MEISHIFDTGSQALTDYLTKNAVGTKIQSPNGGTIWTVTNVEVDNNIPPNPSSGLASTKVVLTVI